VVRRGALRLSWTAYDGTTIRLRQRKTGVYVSIPVADALKAALDGPWPRFRLQTAGATDFLGLIHYQQSTIL
jgi:hypothetical protein